MQTKIGMKINYNELLHNLNNISMQIAENEKKKSSDDWSDQFQNNRSQHFMEQEGSKDNDDDDKTQN